MITIKHRFANEIIAEGESYAEIFSKTKHLSYVNLSCADLSYVNLSGANLSGADLSGADLSYVNLSGANLSYATYGEGVPLTREPMQIAGLPYFVLIMDTHIKIGCQLHTTERWAGFSDEQIRAMDGVNAITFWSKYKDFILTAARAHQNV